MDLLGLSMMDDSSCNNTCFFLINKGSIKKKGLLHGIDHLLRHHRGGIKPPDGLA